MLECRIKKTHHLPKSVAIGQRIGRLGDREHLSGLASGYSSSHFFLV